MSISVKIAGILVAAAFVTGAFLASPELRAYAANTVRSIDIVDGTIQSIDIGNGQVKTIDIGFGMVTSAKIKDGTVMTNDVANDAVTSDKLADNVFDGLQSQIDALTTENAAQQVEIDDLTTRVEALEAAGSDPDVDDDSDGFTENQGDCDDANADVNPSATEIANGVDDDCDGTVDNVPAPDTYEPNESLVGAVDIGDATQFGTSLSINANMHSTADEDWYTADALESGVVVVDDLNIEITLTNIPAGSNYDLFVTCPNCSGGTSISSISSGNSDESISGTNLFSMDISGDDSVTLQIEVRNVSNTASANEYTLTITVT